MPENLHPERLPTKPDSAPAGRYAARQPEAKPASKNDPNALLKRGVFIPKE